MFHYKPNRLRTLLIPLRNQDIRHCLHLQAAALRHKRLELCRTLSRFPPCNTCLGQTDDSLTGNHVADVLILGHVEDSLESGEVSRS